jgi:hypothetical protein
MHLIYGFDANFLIISELGKIQLRSRVPNNIYSHSFQTRKIILSHTNNLKSLRKFSISKITTR